MEMNLILNLLQSETSIDSDITTVDNGNNLSIMQLNRYLRITPNALHNLSEPWTFLFSAKL